VIQAEIAVLHVDRAERHGQLDIFADFNAGALGEEGDGAFRQFQLDRQILGHDA
jgi:hypothetical protein